MTTMTDDTPAPGPADDVPTGPRRLTGRQLREQLADDGWLDELIDRAGEDGVPLTGEGGFRPELIKAVLERGHARLRHQRVRLPPDPARGDLHAHPDPGADVDRSAMTAVRSRPPASLTRTSCRACTAPLSGRCIGSALLRQRPSVAPRAHRGRPRSKDRSRPTRRWR